MMAEASTWMPLYIGDYLADTMHLSGPEHGAYLLLIMHYWRTGPLPDDDKVLSAIARTDRKEWMSDIGPVVRTFFQLDGSRLHHKRIDAELAKAVQNSSKRKEAANARWDKSRCKTDASAYANASDVDVDSISKTDDPRARLPSPSQIEIPSLRSGPPTKIDPGKALFDEGGATLARMTGKAPRALAGFLSLCRKSIKDDAALLGIIRDADARKVLDPIGWVRAAVKARESSPLLAAADDPWGIQGWIARQQIATTGKNAKGEVKPVINGYVVEEVAEEVAIAADLDPAWRGNWNTIGDWMRQDIGLTDAAIEAIRSQAGRMRANGQTIGGIQVFDSAVRTAAGRSAA